MNNTSPFVKIFAVLGFLIVLIGAFFIWKIQHDLTAQQDTINKSIVEMKQLGDGIVRAQSFYATKNDIEKLIKNSDLSKIKEDLDGLGAKLQGVSIVVSSTHGSNAHGLSSSSKIGRTDGTPGSQADPFGFLSNAQVLGLNEPFAGGTIIPFGSTTFKAWQKNPWDVEIYPRDYKITNVLGEDEEGRHYIYNKFIIATNGKEYIVPIQQAKFEEIYPTASFRFSPRLYLGLDVGTHLTPVPSVEVSPTIQIALFSYGKTKMNPDWTLMGLGVGYEAQSHLPNLNFSPVNYNIAQHLPLVKNLYVGPTISLNSQGSFSLLGGIRVGL